MKIIVIGKGTIGSAVAHALKEKGHEVLSVSRNSGELRADLSDPKSLHALFSSVGPFDAVANAAGKVFPGPLEQTTPEQWANSINSKGMGQINLVREALPFIADRGSFTLVSGVLTDEYMHNGTIGTTVNHLVEGFVRAAVATAVFNGKEPRQHRTLPTASASPPPAHRPQRIREFGRTAAPE